MANIQFGFNVLLPCYEIPFRCFVGLAWLDGSGTCLTMPKMMSSFVQDPQPTCIWVWFA